jgi:hypothetical protein
MEINLKVKLDDLQIELEDLAEDTARELVRTMATLAEQTYEKAMELAGQRLHSTRQEYMNALNFDREGEGPGIFVVSLDPEANHLEDGYDTYQMLPKLAQGPASKTAKDGHKYTIIPIRQTTVPVNPNNQKQVDLASRLKDEVKIRQFKTTQAGVSKQTGKYTTVEKMVSGNSTHPFLKGVVRVREYKSEKEKAGGKPPISSSYFTFRVASEKQNPSEKWVHPGFSGAKIFPDIYNWAEFQLEQLIVELAM